MNTAATHRVSMLEAMLLIRAYERGAGRPRHAHLARHLHLGRPGSRGGRRGRARSSAQRPHPHQPPQRRPPARARRRPRPHDGRGAWAAATATARARAASLHISAKELGVILTSTIVGGELSLATGVALSQTMAGPSRHRRRASSATAPPAKASSTSRSTSPSVWNLPLLYVCENNQWQAYVRRRETMRDGRTSRERARRLWHRPADRATATTSRPCTPPRATPRRTIRANGGPLPPRARHLPACAATTSPTTRPTSIRPSSRAGARRDPDRTLLEQRLLARGRDRRRASSHRAEAATARRASMPHSAFAAELALARRLRRTAPPTSTPEREKHAMTTTCTRRASDRRGAAPRRCAATRA